MKSGYLVLENGTVFKGFRFGADVASIGELVFQTGVCGYIETLTDPSYAGQIVTQTFPLIGNYGVIPADFEGVCAVRGYIVREWCDTPSNFRCEGDLDGYLREQGVPGLCGIDTRQLTRILRESGVMNAMICDEIPADLTPLKTYAVAGEVAKVSRRAPEIFSPQGEARLHVALMDYGCGKHVIEELLARGCQVTCLPHDTSAEAVLALSPDGVLLSCGPGNPAENTDCIAEIRTLLGKIPLFGIGLGHQLLALAAGAETVKLKHGHRGANQPVRECSTGRVHITAQNHGWAVTPESLEAAGARVCYVNVNDGTCEGAEYPGLQAFSLQFPPESHTGPLAMEFSFDKFITMMGGNR